MSQSSGYLWIQVWNKEEVLVLEKKVDLTQTPEAELRLGRGMELDIPVQDQHISKLHASLKINADEVTVRDNGSRNGLFDENHLRVGEVKVLRSHPKSEFSFYLGLYRVRVSWGQEQTDITHSIDIEAFHRARHQVKSGEPWKFTVALVFAGFAFLALHFVLDGQLLLAKIFPHVGRNLIASVLLAAIPSFVSRFHQGRWNFWKFTAVLFFVSGASVFYDDTILLVAFNFGSNQSWERFWMGLRVIIFGGFLFWILQLCLARIPRVRLAFGIVALFGLLVAIQSADHIAERGKNPYSVFEGGNFKDGVTFQIRGFDSDRDSVGRALAAIDLSAEAIKKAASATEAKKTLGSP